MSILKGKSSSITIKIPADLEKSRSYCFPKIKHRFRPSDDGLNDPETSIQFLPITPSAVKSGQAMGRVFPQSLPKKEYPQNQITGLRSYQNKNNDIKYFVYEEDLTIENNIPSHNTAQIITLCNKNDYIYKKSYIKIQYLPRDHDRTINEIKYFSNSRVMMQIMSRNLLELFLKNEQNVILPDIYPVVNINTGEICGLISKKIDCEDYTSLEDKLKTKELSEEIIEKKRNIIDEKSQSMGLLVLAKIIGIDDLTIPFKHIKNIGLTPDEKLVLFDFGVNLLDYEEKRYSFFKTDDDYEFVLFNQSLKHIINTYLKAYETLQNKLEKNGTAKIVHPDIQKIIMDTGPGDKKFREKLAKLIQARINNAILQAEKIV